MAVCIASSITNQTAALPVAAIASATAIISLSYYLYRKKRTQWQQAEEEKGHEALHSIIAHFRELHLDPETTVEEANQRRTTSYYEKARAAHLNVLVSGVGSYSLLQKLRRQEMDNILRHYNEGTKSHRTVVAMCDSTTAALLKDAREKILEPLNYSTDPSTPGVWIPELNVIPEQDMHVTIAIPWWWHTIREVSLMGIANSLVVSDLFFSLYRAVHSQATLSSYIHRAMINSPGTLQLVSNKLSYSSFTTPFKLSCSASSC